MPTVKLEIVIESVRAVLDNGATMTYRELEQQTGYSERHIRRALDAMEQSGIMVGHQGWPRQFFIVPEQLRSPCHALMLTEEEILALRIAAQASSAILAPTPLAGSLKSAFRRLLETVDDSSISFDMEAQQRQWYFDDAPSSNIPSEIFNALRRAIDNWCSVRIDYYTASNETYHSGRKVDPYCMTVRGGTWLLVAWCHLRQAMREFNLVDISRVELCAYESDVNPRLELRSMFDPEVYFRDRFRYLGGREVIEVRLLVEQHESRWFRRKNYHPTQQITERDDGRIEVSFEVEGVEEIRSFVQGWGPSVTVLAPEELRQIIYGQAVEVAEKYEPTPHAESRNRYQNASLQ